jgi:hypothetical protein
MIGVIRHLLEEYGQLRVPADMLRTDADLYVGGLTPFAAIRLIIALEQTFEPAFTG